MPRTAPDTDADSRHRRRLFITLTATALIVALAAGVGIYGLISGPSLPAPDGPASGQATAASKPPPIASVGLKSLPTAHRPEAFARTVAVALFGWDTMSGRDPADYADVLIAGADPSGSETPGLIDDLTNYLPTPEMWRELQAYETAQTLTIGRLYVPEKWQDAIDTAHGALPPGAIAYTVEGTRHRTGTWYGETVTSERPIAFTIFLSCPPDPGHCYLLRLSAPGKPLR